MFWKTTVLLLGIYALGEASHCLDNPWNDSSNMPEKKRQQVRRKTVQQKQALSSIVPQCSIPKFLGTFSEHTRKSLSPKVPMTHKMPTPLTSPLARATKQVFQWRGKNDPDLKSLFDSIIKDAWAHRNRFTIHSQNLSTMGVIAEKSPGKTHVWEVLDIYGGQVYFSTRQKAEEFHERVEDERKAKEKAYQKWKKDLETETMRITQPAVTKKRKRNHQVPPRIR